MIELNGTHLENNKYGTWNKDIDKYTCKWIIIINDLF